MRGSACRGIALAIRALILRKDIREVIDLDVVIDVIVVNYRAVL